MLWFSNVASRKDETVTDFSPPAPRKTSKASAPKTIGFGCPTTVAPHRFIVDIPRGSTAPVVIIEDFGIQGGQGDLPEELERVILDRSRWVTIASEVKRAFNQRLKSQGLTRGVWKSGMNLVDRLLGKELTVLAWAVEKVDPKKIPVAVRNWLALRPEERWWLYGMTVAVTGGVNDGEKGWRVALRYALAESPGSAVIVPKRPIKNSSSGVQLSLFSGVIMRED